MIDGRTVLALVPARGGSKGLPGKNLRPLAGRPLIAWTIGAAQRSTLIDRVILSSDDDQIIETARRLGCEAPFVRPSSLATDEAGAMEVVRHALEAEGEGYDYLVLLQPTSPLRTEDDIDATLSLCHQRGAPAVTVCAAEKSPFWMFRRAPDGRLEPLFDDIPKRRQDAPAAVVLNGAVYAASTAHLRDGNDFLGPSTVAHLMPPDRSVDIDTALDLRWAELLLQERMDGALPAP